MATKATPLFHDTGTTAGWDSTLHEHNGSSFDVKNVFYNGPTAIKAIQVYDPSYSGSSKTVSCAVMLSVYCDSFEIPPRLAVGRNA